MSAKPPEHSHHHHHHKHQPAMWAPKHSPSPTVLSTSSSLILRQSPPSKLPIDFSPPLIAMVVFAAAAFLLVTYSRLISRHLFPPFHRVIHRFRRWRRRPHFPPSDLESLPPPYESSDGFYVYSPCGVDESVIKSIPLTIYKPPKFKRSSSAKLESKEVEECHDCAVCLIEFEDGDYIRTLPLCYHSFHVDCIDMWLRSHPTCPLCRAGVFIPLPPPESPLTPVMAARIRPSLDEGVLLESMFLEPLIEAPELISDEFQRENDEEFFSPERRTFESEDHRSNRRELDFLLKRSYSFGFERSFPSERIVLGAATTPHRHQRCHHHRRSFFWTKLPSSTPFSSIAKSRVFSFRQNRGGGGGMIKSPAFFRRRSFFPSSESSASLRYGDGSSRRLKSSMSPLFARAGIFSSSRMRLGDPEALISPERYERG